MLYSLLTGLGGDIEFLQDFFEHCLGSVWRASIVCHMSRQWLSDFQKNFSHVSGSGGGLGQPSTWAHFSDAYSLITVLMIDLS